MITGHCHCGAVAFTITGPLRPSIACHCETCRRLSGHYWSATQTLTSHLNLTRDDGLTWYASSDIAQRAFCRFCGSSLFYRLHNSEYTSIGTGTLDSPTGLYTESHIYLEEKGDYYRIIDNAETSNSHS